MTIELVYLFLKWSWMTLGCIRSLLANMLPSWFRFVGIYVNNRPIFQFSLVNPLEIFKFVYNMSIKFCLGIQICVYHIDSIVIGVGFRRSINLTLQSSLWPPNWIAHDIVIELIPSAAYIALCMVDSGNLDVDYPTAVNAYNPLFDLFFVGRGIHIVSCSSQQHSLRRLFSLLCFSLLVTWTSSTLSPCVCF